MKYFLLQNLFPFLVIFLVGCYFDWKAGWVCHIQLCACTRTRTRTRTQTRTRTHFSEAAGRMYRRHYFWVYLPYSLCLSSFSLSCTDIAEQCQLQFHGISVRKPEAGMRIVHTDTISSWHVLKKLGIPFLKPPKVYLLHTRLGFRTHCIYSHYKDSFRAWETCLTS